MTQLEDQINNRLSVKSVLGLSFSQPVPDHSTFSRFRGRLSKEAMDQINSEILRQFEQQGLSINEGVAVDARLVKSASRPLSQDELKKQRERRQTEDGNRAKNGSRLSSRGILSPTGPFAMIDLISGLKSMPQ